jgi:hypothetical protein
MVAASNDVQLTLSEMVADQAISPGDWQSALRQEIKDNYLTQYFVGRGGREQMTPQDWGSVGGMIGEQYGYLEDFAAEVAAGDLSQGQIYNRARMYINSSREAYERGLQRTVEERGYTEHRWVLANAEHCEDCISLAEEGWKPVEEPFISPSTGEETLPGMGDTICLTSCQCHIEYR